MMNPSAASELVGLFRHQLAMCRLTEEEVCVVITDTAFNPVYADACLGAALSMGAKAYKQVLPFDHPVPDRSLGASWAEADLIVYMSSHSLHYNRDMGRALDGGTRILMAVQPLQVMSRLRAHPDVVARTRAGALRLQEARTIRIRSDAGTDLVMECGDRPALAHYGVADVPGHLDFWGAGMVETAQLEGTTEGRLVLDVGDANFSFGRYMEAPVVIEFAKGRIEAIDGGLDARLLREFLGSFDDDNAWCAGHTSWGTDHRALWTALVHAITPEAGISGADIEAHYGNVQVQIGSNNDINFGGRIASAAHLGLCCKNTSLWLDETQVIDRGQFVFEDMQ